MRSREARRRIQAELVPKDRLIKVASGVSKATSVLCRLTRASRSCYYRFHDFACSCSGKHIFGGLARRVQARYGGDVLMIL